MREIEAKATAGPSTLLRFDRMTVLFTSWKKKNPVIAELGDDRVFPMNF
jgi:hypothetical protein